MPIGYPFPHDMIFLCIYVAFSFIYTIFLKEYTSEIFYLIISIPLASSTFDLMQSGVHLEVTQSLACKNIPAILLDYILEYFFVVKIAISHDFL